MEKIISILIGIGTFLFFYSVTSYAQLSSGSATDSISIFSGSLSPDTLVKRNPKGIIVPYKEFKPLDWGYTFRDTMFYDPSFLPIVFDGKLLPENLDFRSKDTDIIAFPFHLIDPQSTFLPLIRKSHSINDRRKRYYTNTNNIKNITYTRAEFSDLPPLVNDETVTKTNIFHNLIKAEEPKKVKTPEEIIQFEQKPVYWFIKGEHSLQISQNHISDNWYQGGNSNYMIRNYHKLNIDFKKGKITINNIIEWKLGLQSTTGDTLRDVSINDDLFRISSVFGYKAYNNWSYSSVLEMKTPLFNTYPENSNNRRASILSPFDLNLGIGMSYSIDKKFENKLNKRVRFSTNLSPLSINFRYVRSDKVDETYFGLNKGGNTKTDYGSLVNANLEFNFNGFVTWTSRLKYFTNYERVEAEFENKLNMSFNRYLSTTLGVYLRFDDNVPRDDKLGYFQVNELLSIGLNYKW